MSHSKQTIDRLLNSLEQKVRDSLGADYVPRTKERCLHLIDAGELPFIAKRKAFIWINEEVEGS